MYGFTQVKWKKKYETSRPQLFSRYHVHLNSQRSYVVDLEPDGDPSRPPRLITTVTSDGGKILSMCRGQATVHDILGELGYVGDDPESVRIKNFLAHAAAQSHITWNPDGDFQPKRQLTGSLHKYVPAHVSIEVTDACNLKCKYCYHGDLSLKTQPSDDLSLEDLISVLEDWRALGLLGVELTGGEPTISSKFIPLLKFCLDNFSLVAILTNGTNSSDEMLDLIADTKCKVLVAFSLDAPTPELFSEITGVPAKLFDKILGGIIRVKELGLQTNVAMTVTQDNVDHVYAMAEFLKKLDVTGFSPALAAPAGYAFDDRWKWDMFLNYKFYDQINTIRKKYPIFLTNLVNIARAKPKEEGMPKESCDIGKRSAILGPDGRLRACLMMPITWSVGSVRNQSIEEILLSDAFQEFAKILFPPLETCKGCVYEQFCEGCALTPLSVARKEGCLCAWWEESGLAGWLRKYARGDTVDSLDSIKRFTDKKQYKQCNHCPTFLD
jgi:radical SAM protein with 4Fe4S-binding SPASM domain